jgi:hypothetical protein
MQDPTPTTSRLVLRDLSLSLRLVLALFLCSVGLGYFSALINLHFQSASPGEMMPTADDVVTDYAGKTQVSQFERLLTARDTLPFNGQGSMRSAYSRRAGGKESAFKEKAKDLGHEVKDPEDLKKIKDEDRERIRKEVAQEMDGERLAMIAWARDPNRKGYFEEEKYPLTGKLAELRITKRFLLVEDGKKYFLVNKNIESRCTRCHQDGSDPKAGQYPLTSYDEIAVYLEPEGPTGKSLEKLALTTHVHLLGFSMLYGLTGMIFALTSYPAWLRLLIAPLPLLAQVVDIAFWWLARMEPPYGHQFAEAIRISGGVVGVSLAMHIVLGVWNLFGKTGKVVVLLLLVGTGAGAHFAHEKIIAPYLAHEKGQSSSLERK